MGIMKFKAGIILVLIAVSLNSTAAPNGGKLYQQHCAACHGSDGKGGVGVPISLPSFLDSVSDQYLIKTIREGRPDRVMPAHLHMSDAQVESIVKFIRHWSVAKAPVYDQKHINGDIKDGKKLFAQYCAGCHGANGEGGTGTGVTFSRPRNLPVIAPALNNAGFLAASSDAMIKRTLMKGREGTPMNSFIQLGLKEKQINNIVSYVRSFSKHKTLATDASKEPGSLIYESSENMKDTLASLKKSIIGANFKVIRVQKFESGFVAKGKEDPKKIIVYFCNFNMLNRALAIDPRVGLFLPCRITLIEKQGIVKLISINPTAMSGKFNNSELNKLCEEMKHLYESILEEAAL